MDNVCMLFGVKEDGRTPQILRLTVRKVNKKSSFSPSKSTEDSYYERSSKRESRQCPIPKSAAAKIFSGMKKKNSVKSKRQFQKRHCFVTVTLLLDPRDC